MEQLNHNFQIFVQTIRDWPSSTIEKKALLQLFNDFLDNNPELQNVYEDASVPALPVKSYTSRREDYSRVDPTKSPTAIEGVSNPITYVTLDPPPATRQDTPVVSREPSFKSNTPMRKTVIKQGDLTVKKPSPVLEPRLKKYKSKMVYGELALASQEDPHPLIYFTLYQNQQSKQVIHKFILDHECSFTKSDKNDKRDLLFKHGSSTESFITESGSADSWVEAFKAAIVPEIEEVYETPEDLTMVSVALLPSNHKSLEGSIPSRAPPRPPRHINPISPEQIYVCLYDHASASNTTNELQFKCGDLLYLINTEGINFYVGHKLVLPWDPHHQPALGFVYKEYIRPAYEKAC